LRVRYLASVLLVVLCVILAGVLAFAQNGQHPSESAAELVEQFKRETVFWKQFEVAKKIVALHDKSVLPALEPWLSNEDRSLRGNAAYIFAKLGDDRGFQVIKGILADR
jgi:HEAT repeat protein